jgi:hypothetical protein
VLDIHVDVRVRVRVVPHGRRKQWADRHDVLEREVVREREKLGELLGDEQAVAVR